MTETEWLTSDDPAAMLAFVTGKSEGPHAGGIVSDRKLRLFACACRRFAGYKWPADGWGDMEDHPEREIRANNLPSGAIIPAIEHAMLFVSENQPVKKDARLTLPVAASLLRDIVGNPFRPLNILTRASARWGLWKSGKWGGCITVDVLLLARQAYEERPGSMCKKCEGDGWDPYRDSLVEKARCVTCHGTGRIDDGTLDALTLAALADALEEAGCEDEAILRHLRGHVTAYRDNAIAYFYTDTSGSQLTPDYARKAHVHVRGCHVLDVLLGRD